MQEGLGKLLVVDDDPVFRLRLAKAMMRHRFQVKEFDGSDSLEDCLHDFYPSHAVVDLRMPGEGGLSLVAKLKTAYPETVIVVLTGYGSIASALEAIRLGAADYLTKPCESARVAEALRGLRPRLAGAAYPTLDSVEWEHIHRVLTDCDHNISKASKFLGIDRRSLQRKLAKRPQHLQ